MIRFLPLQKYLDFKTDKSIDFYVGEDQAVADPDLICAGEVLPSKKVWDLWDKSAKTLGDWERFSRVYEYELRNSYQPQRFVKKIELMDKAGLSVNVVCSCNNPERCIRSILYRFLDGKVEEDLL